MDDDPFRERSELGLPLLDLTDEELSAHERFVRGHTDEPTSLLERFAECRLRILNNPNNGNCKVKVQYRPLMSVNLRWLLSELEREEESVNPELLKDPILFARAFFPKTAFYREQKEILYSIIHDDETWVPAGNG